MGKGLCKWRNHSMLCAMALSSWFSQLAAAQTVAVPFHSQENLLFIQVFIEGRAANLILDTGAEATLLSPEIVGMSNTVGVGRFRSNLQMVKTISRNTSISLIKYGREFSLPVVVVSLNDFSKKLGYRCDGILGQDFLRNFRALTIDYKSHTITFTH